jgi:hypothetical protein
MVHALTKKDIWLLQNSMSDKLKNGTSAISVALGIPDI